MGKKKKDSKSPRRVALRRSGDLVLSDHARKAIEKLLGGKHRVLELARQLKDEEDRLRAEAIAKHESVVVDITETGQVREVQLKETVRIVLDQTKNAKMIVVKRSADLAPLIQEVLPKIRLKKANKVYLVAGKAKKYCIADTLAIPDGSRLFFAFEKEASTSPTTPSKDAAETSALCVPPEAADVSFEQDANNIEESEDVETVAEEEEANVGAAKEDVQQTGAGEDDDEEIDDDDEDDDDDDDDDDELNADDKEEEEETVEADLLKRAHQALQADNRLDQIAKPLGPVQIDFAVARKKRSPLPIDANEKALIEAIQAHTVTVVRAPTGSGKSTRIAQFILENTPTAKMVVTEPRRIAAMSLADRVAFELGERNVGNHVGYSIRTESKQSANTRILFCTVGVLLRRISFDPSLQGITHVLVDEAHERDVLTDTLLIFLRKALLSNERNDLKIIVLSATIDTSKFKEYFLVRGIPSTEISVEGFCYPVQELYLEDLERQVGRTYAGFQQNGGGQSNTPSKGGKQAKGGGTPVAKGGNARGNKADQTSKPRKLFALDVEFIARLVQRYVSIQLKGDLSQKRSVLIFVGGKRDISRTISHLEQHMRSQVWALPLHSQLSSEDQRKVFNAPRDSGKVKVVVATNIAETSITIDDCGLVIDTCRVKESRYDADSRAWQLEEALISRSAMKQRRGRAGRTGPGICYHLVYSDEVLEDQPTPGMRKDSLEDSIMLVKAVRANVNAFEFFAEAIDPPDPLNILRILEDLSDLGVIRGHYSDREDATELTPLGFALSRLGTDCRKGKLLILGLLLGCLDPVLTIAATLDGKSPFLFFSHGETARKTCDRIRRRFGDDDFCTMVNARDAFVNGKIDDSVRDILSVSALKLNEQLRKEFINDLIGAGFISGPEDVSAHSKQGRDWRVIRCCLAGGLFPHVGRVGQEQAIVTGPHELLPSRLDFASTLFRVNKVDMGVYFVYHQRARISSSGGGGSSDRPAMMNVQRAIAVNPLALALLGGGFSRARPRDLTSKNKFTCIRLGKCWLMRAKPKDAVLIQHLRRALDDAFLGMFERRAVSKHDEELLEVLRISTS